MYFTYKDAFNMQRHQTILSGRAGYIVNDSERIRNMKIPRFLHMQTCTSAV